MPADLGPVGIRAFLVGVVHHVGAEPQDATLDRVEQREVGGGDAHGRSYLTAFRPNQA